MYATKLKANARKSTHSGKVHLGVSSLQDRHRQDVSGSSSPQGSQESSKAAERSIWDTKFTEVQLVPPEDLPWASRKPAVILQSLSKLPAAERTPAQKSEADRNIFAALGESRSPPKRAAAAADGGAPAGGSARSQSAHPSRKASSNHSGRSGKEFVFKKPTAPPPVSRLHLSGAGSQQQDPSPKRAAKCAPAPRAGQGQRRQRNSKRVHVAESAPSGPSAKCRKLQQQPQQHNPPLSRPPMSGISTVLSKNRVIATSNVFRQLERANGSKGTAGRGQRKRPGLGGALNIKDLEAYMNDHLDAVTDELEKIGKASSRKGHKSSTQSNLGKEAGTHDTDTAVITSHKTVTPNPAQHGGHDAKTASVRNIHTKSTGKKAASRRSPSGTTKTNSATRTSGSYQIIDLCQTESPSTKSVVQQMRNGSVGNSRTPKASPPSNLLQSSGSVKRYRASPNPVLFKWSKHSQSARQPQKPTEKYVVLPQMDAVKSLSLKTSIKSLSARISIDALPHRSAMPGPAHQHPGESSPPKKHVAEADGRSSLSPKRPVKCGANEQQQSMSDGQADRLAKACPAGRQASRASLPAVSARKTGPSGISRAKSPPAKPPTNPPRAGTAKAAPQGDAGSSVDCGPQGAPGDRVTTASHPEVVLSPVDLPTSDSGDYDDIGGFAFASFGSQSELEDYLRRESKKPFSHSSQTKGPPSHPSKTKGPPSPPSQTKGPPSHPSLTKGPAKRFKGKRSSQQEQLHQHQLKLILDLQRRSSREVLHPRLSRRGFSIKKTMIAEGRSGINLRAIGIRFTLGKQQQQKNVARRRAGLTESRKPSKMAKLKADFIRARCATPTTGLKIKFTIPGRKKTDAETSSGPSLPSQTAQVAAKAAEPKATEPKAVEPKAKEPKAAEPKAKEPEAPRVFKKLPERESIPFKPFEKQVQSARSAFVSDALDKYLQQEKQQAESAFLSGQQLLQRKPATINFKYPERQSSYIKTLDTALQERQMAKQKTRLPTVAETAEKLAKNLKHVSETLKISGKEAEAEPPEGQKTPAGQSCPDPGATSELPCPTSEPACPTSEPPCPTSEPPRPTSEPPCPVTYAEVKDDASALDLSLKNKAANLSDKKLLLEEKLENVKKKLRESQALKKSLPKGKTLSNWATKLKIVNSRLVQQLNAPAKNAHLLKSKNANARTEAHVAHTADNAEITDYSNRKRKTRGKKPARFVRLDQQTKCTKDFCSMGCICDSINLNVSVEKLTKHCRKPDCMLECSCKRSSVRILRNRRRPTIFQEKSMLFYGGVGMFSNSTPRLGDFPEADKEKPGILGPNRGLCARAVAYKRKRKPCSKEAETERPRRERSPLILPPSPPPSPSPSEKLRSTPTLSQKPPASSAKEKPMAVQSGLPGTPSGLPLVPSGLPGMPGGLPIVPSGLPGTPSGLPIVPSGLPIVPSGLPRKPSGLPIVPSGLPRKPSGLPIVPSGLPGTSSSLPGMPSGLPIVPSGLPGMPSVAGIMGNAGIKPNEVVPSVLYAPVKVPLNGNSNNTVVLYAPVNNLPYMVQKVNNNPLSQPKTSPGPEGNGHQAPLPAEASPQSGVLQVKILSKTSDANIKPLAVYNPTTTLPGNPALGKMRTLNAFATTPAPPAVSKPSAECSQDPQSEKPKEVPVSSPPEAIQKNDSSSRGRPTDSFSEGTDSSSKGTDSSSKGTDLSSKGTDSSSNGTELSSQGTDSPSNETATMVKDTDATSTAPEAKTTEEDTSSPTSDGSESCAREEAPSENTPETPNLPVTPITQDSGMETDDDSSSAVTTAAVSGEAASGPGAAESAADTVRAVVTRTKSPVRSPSSSPVDGSAPHMGSPVRESDGSRSEPLSANLDLAKQLQAAAAAAAADRKAVATGKPPVRMPPPYPSRPRAVEPDSKPKLTKTQVYLPGTSGAKGPKAASAAAPQRSPLLVEIQSECDWSETRNNVLNAISKHTASKGGAAGLVRVGKFMIEILQKDEYKTVNLIQNPSKALAQKAAAQGKLGKPSEALGQAAGAVSRPGTQTSAAAPQALQAHPLPRPPYYAAKPQPGVGKPSTMMPTDGSSRPINLAGAGMLHATSLGSQAPLLTMLPPGSIMLSDGKTPSGYLVPLAAVQNQLRGPAPVPRGHPGAELSQPASILIHSMAQKPVTTPGGSGASKAAPPVAIPPKLHPAAAEHSPRQTPSPSRSGDAAAALPTNASACASEQSSASGSPATASEKQQSQPPGESGSQPPSCADKSATTAATKLSSSSSTGTAVTAAASPAAVGTEEELVDVESPAGPPPSLNSATANARHRPRLLKSTVPACQPSIFPVALTAEALKLPPMYIPIAPKMPYCPDELRPPPLHALQGLPGTLPVPLPLPRRPLYDPEDEEVDVVSLDATEKSRPADSAGRGSRRKRKSPVRLKTTAMAFEEPEFIESFYEVSSGEEEEPDRTDTKRPHKVMHLIKERQRRKNQSDLFGGLKLIMINDKDSKVAKITILEMALKEIKLLESSSFSLEIERSRLKQENFMKRSRLALFWGVNVMNIPSPCSDEKDPNFEEYLKELNEGSEGVTPSVLSESNSQDSECLSMDLSDPENETEERIRQDLLEEMMGDEAVKHDRESDDGAAPPPDPVPASVLGRPARHRGLPSVVPSATAASSSSRPRQRRSASSNSPRETASGSESPVPVALTALPFDFNLAPLGQTQERPGVQTAEAPGPDPGATSDVANDFLEIEEQTEVSDAVDDGATDASEDLRLPSMDSSRNSTSPTDPGPCLQSSSGQDAAESTDTTGEPSADSGSEQTCERDADSPEESASLNSNELGEACGQDYLLDAAAAAAQTKLAVESEGEAWEEEAARECDETSEAIGGKTDSPQPEGKPPAKAEGPDCRNDDGDDDAASPEGTPDSEPNRTAPPATDNAAAITTSGSAPLSVRSIKSQDGVVSVTCDSGEVIPLVLVKASSDGTMQVAVEGDISSEKVEELLSKAEVMECLEKVADDTCKK